MARIRQDEPLSFQEELGLSRRAREGDARVLGESWSSGTFGRSPRCPTSKPLPTKRGSRVGVSVG